MPESPQPSTPADRDRTQSRLRTLTRGVIVAATGATVALGVVVAHDRQGAGAVRSTDSTSSSSKSTGSMKTQTSSDGGTSNSADSGTTGNTGTSSSSSTGTPTSSSSSPTVTSGAS